MDETPVGPLRQDDEPKPLDTTKDPVALDDDSLTAERMMADEPVINTGRIIDEVKEAAGAPPPQRHFQLPHQRSAIIAVGILLLLIGIGVVVLFTAAKPFRPKPSQTIVINTQTLSSGTLNQLKSQLQANGQVQEQLTITPNTLFKGNVEIQGSLQVHKDINADSNLNVSGNTTLQGTVTTGSSLNVHGSLNVGNSASITGNLSVGGLLAVSSLSIGTLTTNTITVSNNLTLGGHLVPTGLTPTIKTSNAAAGGSVTISGNDTDGTVTITSSSIQQLQQIAGEMAIITFHTPFATTPKVQLTPVNAAAAGLRYYVQQSAGFFAIETANAPAPSTAYTFNYLVIQ